MGSDVVIRSRMDCCPVGSMVVEDGGGDRAAGGECTTGSHGGKVAPADGLVGFRLLRHLEHRAWQVVERVPLVRFEVVVVVLRAGWLVLDLY